MEFNEWAHESECVSSEETVYRRHVIKYKRRT
jgi:hypothetical protein